MKKPIRRTTKTSRTTKTPKTPKTTARGMKTPRLPADLKIALAAAMGRQAVDLRLLDLRKASSFTDFFVIGTGANVRQVQAIADAVQEALRKHGVKPALVEGYERAGWVLIDYFDFIVHIFTPATREYYALERLWGDAVHIEIPATLNP
jgi:ribosome-associated protein